MAKSLTPIPTRKSRAGKNAAARSATAKNPPAKNPPAKNLTAKNLAERTAVAKKRSTALSSGSTEVEDSIRPYAIADKLRALRLRRSMGLQQLAEHTGLSPAMLSRLENGRLLPTLTTLTRIALVFNVGLDHFFNDPRRHHVVAVARKSERRQLPADPKAPAAPWHFESLDFRANERKLQGFLAHFHPLPGEKPLAHHHPGVELIYIIRGALEMTLGGEIIPLAAGDSIYFDAMQKHAYRNPGKGDCTAIVVTTGAAA